MGIFAYISVVFMEECPIMICRTSFGIPFPRTTVQAKVCLAMCVVNGKVQPIARPMPFRNWLYF